jgi:hypothetical protein
MKTLPKVPNAVNDTFMNIVRIIKSFCDDKLNNEYYELSVKLAAKIARKKPSPLLFGKINTWAAGIIHAIGMVNCVFDKSITPNIQFQDIEKHFDLSSSTISSKSKSIRDMCKIYQLDPEWSLPSRIDKNPLVWLVKVNGFIIDIRNAPLELQLEALNAGVIPYIPEKKNKNS